jgi:hypothetical protein
MDVSQLVGVIRLDLIGGPRQRRAELAQALTVFRLGVDLLATVSADSFSERDMEHRLRVLRAATEHAAERIMILLEAEAADTPA